MWNVRKENDQVILVVNGEKALCRQGKEFGPVKGITTGKRSGELVVEFEGGNERRTLSSSLFEDAGLTEEGIVEKIMATIGNPPAPSIEKRKRKRRFLETEEMGASLLIGEEEDIDEAIAKKCKGNKTIDVDKISTFNLNYCPRPPKTKWVRRLKELMSTDVNVERLDDEFPVLLLEEQYICLGGNHRLQALKEIQLEEPQHILKVITTVYEGLLKEECWRVANLHNVDEKASKARLTFQDQLFQARRLKDSPKMRETLSKVFGIRASQTKSPNSMGTLISVARYPDGLWSLVNKIIQSHEEKYGYQRSLSQPMFRHLQGTSNEVKEKILTEALDHGIEKATKSASELKARQKLRDYFVHASGVQSWTEAEDKFPDASGEVEKFVAPKVSRKQIVPEDFRVFVEASTAEEQPEIDVSIELTVNGQRCEAQYADVLKDHIKHIKESVRFKFQSSPVNLENEQ